MELKLINHNNETILAITLWGSYRNTEIIKWHKKVMVDKFGLDINYIEAPFPNISHGYCMNQIIGATIDSIKPDYYWFLDSDCIILKKETFNIFYDLVKHKKGIAGHVQQSNHKKNRITESLIHPYASQAFLWFPSELYNKLNRPCMDHWSEGSDEYGGDTAERLSYETKKAGGIVSLIYPSNVYLKNSNIDSGLMFGLGNTFSDLIYHSMQQDNPKSQELFIEKCKSVLNGDF